MSYKTSKGSLLVIQITGMGGRYIAEVTEEKPLTLKVTETGPFSNLKISGDFIINEIDSIAIQNDESGDALVAKYFNEKRPLQSGLEVLGVTDGKLHEILPGPVEE
ncbi:MAG: hypothetical protein LiPW41_756 [Parcubacteria group bacterium LiPW_41]|nr:MAG: hypothetical protein LiPW41_756 [Parcubacteria group bacterium LiPW_41]